MEKQCVVGVFDSVSLAQAAVHILNRAGFTPDHVSVVTRHIDPNSEVGKELALGDDSLRDSAIGAALGGLVGFVTDAAVFLITGIGGIVVATGPLAIAMGSVVGAFLGAMEGWGVHTSHIRKYEGLVRHGKVLVVVDGDPREVAAAYQMIRETDATEVHQHAESSADAPEIRGTNVFSPTEVSP